jgi:beta-aspartyl-dipeptidase (metallo-type)
MYAPEAEFYCWKEKPQSGLSGADFWARMESKGIAFKPGVSKTGVFPLTFLTKLSGNFLALGATQEECLQLRDIAKTCLVPNRLVRELQPQRPQQPSVGNLLLIKNPFMVYSPRRLDVAGILVGGEDTVGLLNEAQTLEMDAIVRAIGGRVIDATDLIVTPGFIDIHVHVTGGGGEQGPASRTPEAQISQLLESGTTTVVGLLGTDCVSRSQENLYAKVKSLNLLGMTAYMWAGGYKMPPPNIAGSSERDVHFLEYCVGVGEVALSDHRSSHPSSSQLAQLASDVHVAGMLAGKAGVVYCHMGVHKNRLKPLREVLEQTALPITTFLPTHMARTPELIEEGVNWIRDGGYLDLTAFDAYETILKLHAAAINLEHIIVSSDGYGSCPKFGAHGELISYGMLNPRTLFLLCRKLFFSAHWPLERVLPFMTSNPARFLKLQRQGSIGLGMAADLLLLNKDDLSIQYVVARGKVLKTPEATHKGMFEDFKFTDRLKSDPEAPKTT